MPAAPSCEAEGGRKVRGVSSAGQIAGVVALVRDVGHEAILLQLAKDGGSIVVVVVGSSLGLIIGSIVFNSTQ